MEVFFGKFLMMLFLVTNGAVSPLVCCKLSFAVLPYFPCGKLVCF